MTNDVLVRKHQWTEMRVTPVEVFANPDGTHAIVPIGATPQVRVGCFACNMGIDEGLEVACPGQDLFDDHPEEGGESDVAP